MHTTDFHDVNKSWIAKLIKWPLSVCCVFSVYVGIKVPVDELMGLPLTHICKQ